jgi:hypothetical protein
MVLINLVLSSLPMYLMSFFRIHKGVREKLDYYRSSFFGKATDIKRNIVLRSGVS